MLPAIAEALIARADWPGVAAESGENSAPSTWFCRRWPAPAARLCRTSC